MKKTYLRYLIYILEAYVFNSAVRIQNFNFFGLTVFLIVPVFVYVSLFEKKYFSLSFGIFCGFLVDVSFGSIVGVNAILLGFFSLVFEKLFRLFVKPNFFMVIFMSGFVSVCLLGINFYINYVLKGFDEIGFMFKNYLNITVLTIFVSFPIYFLNRVIFHATRENENER